MQDKPQTEQQDHDQTVKPDLSNITVIGSDGNEIPMTDVPQGLPEGIESIEQLIDRYNDLLEKTKGQNGQDKTVQPEPGEPEEKQELSTEEEDDEEDEDPREQRIRALELQLHDQELLKMVGGEEKYNQIKEWAGQNLEPVEAEMINNVLDSTDLAAKKLVVKSLQALYRDAVGFDGQQISGGNAQTSSMFKSEAELHEAMADPRYRRADAIGEQYRAEVTKRAMGLLGNGADPNGWY